ncbi:MAG: PKD domain-containing protein, partial [Bacteroidota bacterium]|nr:PKD domain-containing protein [Bacteroidota bacterium]
MNKEAKNKHNNFFKIFLLVAILLVFNKLSYSQTGQGNVWCFGNHAGLNFSTGNPVAFYSGQTNNLEGSATISDSAGNLLFYTDGMTIWNANHQTMETGLYGHSSATQSGVIVPHPTNPDTFYVFTIDATQNNLNHGLRYTIVDMSLNSGLGDVPTPTSSSKNQLLTPSGIKMAEKITAVRHCNNVDIWIIGHGYSKGSSNAGGKFYAFLLTPNGIVTTPVISTVGTVHQGGDGSGYGNSRGYLKASSDGRKIALAITYDGCTSYWANWCSSSSGAFEVFDFDYTTGIVSNPIRFKDNFKGAYGIAFSPNGNVLYGGGWGSYGGSIKIWQWNLAAGSATAIKNSQTTVATESSGGFGALQLASDGKIYISRNYKYNLSVIKYPNKLGSSCGYQSNGVSLGSRRCRYGLPTFVASYFDPNHGYTYSNNYEDMITVFMIADSQRIDSVFWNFNDPTTGTSDTSTAFNPVHAFSDTGNYNVLLVIYRCNIIDSIYHSVINYPRPNTGFTINDTLQCFNENRFVFTDTSTIESGTIDYFKWHFGDGDTSNVQHPVHSYSNPGIYTVKLVTTYDHKGMDSSTHQLEVIYSPNAVVGVNDTLQCLSGNLCYFDNNSSISTTSSLSFYWDLGGGDTSTSIYVLPKTYTTADTFAVMLIATSDSACVDTSIQNVFIRPMPNAGFSLNDTAQCLTANNFIFTNNTTIAYDTLSYLWSFGGNDTSTATNPNHSYSSSDTFEVKLLATTNFGCKDSAYQTNIVFPMPNSGFSVNDSNQCLRGNNFVFTNSSSISSGSLSYYWDFGDGDTSTSKNPSHSFATSDTFQVKLLVYSGEGCPDSITKTVYVFPMPNSVFSINDSAQCYYGNSYVFSNSSNISTGSISYLWNFGDSDTSTFTNPTHSYTSDDTFNVKLIVTSALGCKDSLIKSTIVYPEPQPSFSFNDSDQCMNGHQFIITNNSTINSGSMTWFWNFDDGTTSTNENPTHNYSTEDTFEV